MQLGLEDSRRTSVVNIGSVMNSANGDHDVAAHVLFNHLQHQPWRHITKEGAHPATYHFS